MLRIIVQPNGAAGALYVFYQKNKAQTPLIQHLTQDYYHNKEVFYPTLTVYISFL